MMELITTNRGGQKLSFEGYMYTKQISRKDTIRWHCVKRTSDQCKGNLINIINTIFIEL